MKYLFHWLFFAKLQVSFLFFFLSFLRQGLTVLSRLECSGAIMAHSSCNFLGWRDLHTSASQVAGTAGACHHAQLIFWGEGYFFIEMGFHYVAQAGLELLASSNPPVLASKNAGITGVSHCTWSKLNFIFFLRDRVSLMLTRLVLNSWPQAILSSQPVKMLGV